MRWPKSWSFIFSIILPVNIQSWFPLRLTDFISLLSKRLSGVFSSTTVQRYINFLVFCLHYSPALTTVCDHWEDHILENMDVCWQSNASSFQHAVQVCHSFPAKNQSSSDFMAAVTICTDFGAHEEEICHWIHLFPFYSPRSDGAGWHDLSFFFSFFLLFFFFNI